MENQYTFAQASPDNMMFGLGRHACPGRHFAFDTIFIAEASLLAAFNIQKARDAAGNLITPVEEYTTGLIT